MSFNLGPCNDSSGSNKNAHAFLTAKPPEMMLSMLFSGYHTGENMMLTHRIMVM